jgi:hypothetical protein
MKPGHLGAPEPWSNLKLHARRGEGGEGRREEATYEEEGERKRHMRKKERGSDI